MANAFGSMLSGIDFDWGGLGAAISVAFRGAPAKCFSKEIASTSKVKRTVKE
jgi:hypothetical protein